MTLQQPAERPFKRLSPLTPLVRSFILVVAGVASFWDDILRGELGPLAWIVLAMLVAGAVYGTASWLRTKYWIEADELRVDTGIVSRQSRRIRVDRLCSSFPCTTPGRTVWCRPSISSTNGSFTPSL